MPSVSFTIKYNVVLCEGVVDITSKKIANSFLAFTLTQSEQERSCIALLRLQRRCGQFIWVHAVLQLKDNLENSQRPVIVCTNQVLR
ncbi:unnamed protein product [Euphydryas editha]|uniref:Uncharacterized protein n=1 Tax=Euphydryas editha TaxID=104508 RepID=A0AAU9U602_EUPED|nr:unnamed protein product [Euphydryas editha]